MPKAYNHSADTADIDTDSSFMFIGAKEAAIDPE
jgi:hypothetical protein